MKTMSQLARELNISKSTLHRLIQRNEIETIQQGNKNMIDEVSEQAIIKALNGKTFQKETFQRDKIETKTFQNQIVPQMERFAEQEQKLLELQQQLQSITDNSIKLQFQLDILKTENVSLNDKIADKDKTIERLEQDKEYLKSKLDAADANISNLTTALTAAQALHGMDKQQAVIDVKTADDEHSEQSSNSEDQSETQQQPQQKLSFFNRLFKRSKK